MKRLLVIEVVSGGANGSPRSHNLSSGLENSPTHPFDSRTPLRLDCAVGPLASMLLSDELGNMLVMLGAVWWPRQILLRSVLTLRLVIFARSYKLGHCWDVLGHFDETLGGSAHRSLITHRCSYSGGDMQEVVVRPRCSGLWVSNLPLSLRLGLSLPPWLFMAGRAFPAASSSRSLNVVFSG